MARKTNVDRIANAKKMLAQHGDVRGEWRLRFSQMEIARGSASIEAQEWVKGPLSEALLLAAYLLSEYKSVEIADLHGGTTIHLTG